MLQVLKIIYIFCLTIFTLSKIVYGLKNAYVDVKDEILTLIEMITGTILTFAIYKI